MKDQESNRRFDRLETKITPLTEVLTNVARVEEKLIGTDARLNSHELRLDDGEKKLEELVEQVTTNSMVVKVGQGIVASIWAALIGTVAYLFRGQ